MTDLFCAHRERDEAITTDYDRLLALVRESGMDYKWATMFVKKLADDEKQYKADEATKEWALKRGFYPGRVELYGLTEENYRYYMPDYSYFMLHPINHHFRKWLDKLTLKYVLNSGGCEQSMLGNAHNHERGDESDPHQQSHDDECGAERLHHQQDGHRGLWRQSHEPFESGHQLVDMEQLTHTQLQEHHTREQAEEQTRQVAVGMTGAIEE